MHTLSSDKTYMRRLMCILCAEKEKDAPTENPRAFAGAWSTIEQIGGRQLNQLHEGITPDDGRGRIPIREEVKGALFEVVYCGLGTKGWSGVRGLVSGCEV